MAKHDHHRERLARNRASKERAENDHQIWSGDEIEVLLAWDGSDSELDALSELLGRTREACRERFYQTLRGRGATTITRRTTTTTETVVNYGNWDPDDRSPWYV